MQSEQTANELIIRESPGCLWMFGLFFAVIGSIFVYGALGGFVDFGSQPLWVLTLAFLMGAAAVAAAVWLLYHAPITKVVINRTDDFVLIKRFGIFGKRQYLYYFDEFEKFCLVEEKDDENDDIWFLGIELNDGETINISSLASRDQRFVGNFMFAANEFIGRNLLPTEAVFDVEDETDGEMS